MIRKMTVTRISTILFLGGLVILLIGLTLSPRFATAGGGQDFSDLLVNQVFECFLEGDGGVFLGFRSNHGSGLFVQVGFSSNPHLSGVNADCLCVGAVKNVLC